VSAPGLECPFCSSPDVEVVSAWGGQLITRQLRCRACSTYFEAVRDDYRALDADSDPLPDPGADG
jgi:uncharacterized Zn finger protein